LRLTRQLGRAIFAVLVLVWTDPAARAQQKPVVQIDLKPLGAAPDLFADQSEAKYAQRAIANVFWIDNDHIAVAFSATHRWSNSEKPEPLHVRLIIFDRTGKQLHEREWSIGAEGPEAATTLEITPGPAGSILALHRSTAQAPGERIPDGDFIQVFNADASLRQNFYVPASSASAAGSLTDPRLVLQTFFADKHTSLSWWGGNPLKSETQVDLPPSEEENILAGPGVAARSICATKTLCSGIRVFRSGGNPWIVSTPMPEFTPVPLGFLQPDSLLVQMRDLYGKSKGWFVAHPNGQTQLPAVAKSVEDFNVTAVSADSQRFSVDVSGETGVCGALSLYCKDFARALVIDLSTNRVLLEESLSNYGGQSALSPDGKQLAIFDRNKLTIYDVP
jgi:hypothetical protein